MTAEYQKHLFTKRWRRVAGLDPSETAMQIALVDRLRWLARPDVVFWHTPNGGFRDEREAAKFKAMGVLAGVADLAFIMPGPRVAWLELKARGEEPTDEQLAFAERVRACGCTWTCADDLDQAVALINQFGVLR